MILKLTLAAARESIVRKFTNYRNQKLRSETCSCGNSNSTREGDEHSKLVESMKLAASALIDMKTFSKGRNLFKVKQWDEIVRRRGDIMKEDPSMPKVSAYQKALKELWFAADQDWWEAQAAGELEGVYQYVISYKLISFF
jgi:G3E family GTPase